MRKLKKLVHIFALILLLGTTSVFVTGCGDDEGLEDTYEEVEEGAEEAGEEMEEAGEEMGG